MAEPYTLQDRIHQAQCADLPTLQAEAEGYLAAAPDVYTNLFINGWGRELNRRSFNLCGSTLYSTYDGGLRPLNPSEWAGSGATFFFLNEGSGLFLQENGTDRFLRQISP